MCKHVVVVVVVVAAAAAAVGVFIHDRTRARQVPCTGLELTLMLG